MQTTTLARYGAPIAIVAGALMIITRLVILFTTPAEIGPSRRTSSPPPTRSTASCRSWPSRSS